MKRLTTRDKFRRSRYSTRRQLKRQIRGAVKSRKIEKVPQEFRGAISLNCPSKLSLADNFKETYAYFDQLKRLSSIIHERRKYRPTSKIQYSVGLGDVNFISVRCAVILAAEVDRLRRIAGDVLFYNGKLNDDSEPISLLQQIGFFDLVGHHDNAGSHSREAFGHRTAIKLLTGTTCQDDKIQSFGTGIQSICKSYGDAAMEFLHCAIVEAMLNVSHHAYIRSIKLNFPCAGKRWWAVAVVDTEKNVLKVIVYDQGHGIAQTLPSSGFVEEIELFIRKLLFGKIFGSEDEKMLLAALEFSRSRTSKNGRGQGFMDIQKPINEICGARLRIASGTAEAIVELKNDTNYGTKSSSFPNHIGGTLVEWTFPINGVESRR